MDDAIKSFASRIEWCRRQSTQARAPLERAGWQAEEEGLRDALLNNNHTHQYHQGPPGVFERYAMGLQYGREVLRTAAMHQHVALPIHQAGTGRPAGMDGIGNMNMLGLTRHA